MDADLTRARAWLGLFLALCACLASQKARGQTPGAQCVNASPIDQGQAARCSGILLGLEQARAAAQCKAVDLPRCESDGLRDREVCTAKLDGLGAKLAAAKIAAVEPPPWWRLPLVAGGATVGGALLGWVAASLTR